MLQVILNHLLPPRCLNCQIHVGQPHTLCASCWGQIAWISRPFCQCCGRPFSHDHEGAGVDLLCLDCLQNAPPFVQARSAFLYDDFSKALILRFKHGDRSDQSFAFARWMAHAGAELLDKADILVPVPLHWRRLIGRRYNQAALLVHDLSRLSGLDHDVLSLKRVRATQPQGRQGRSARYDNLRHAFKVQGRVDFLNKHVVLVDDVMTTGATVVHCTEALLKAGARSVSVLTLARVERVVMR